MARKTFYLLRYLLISDVAVFDTINIRLLIETIEGKKKIREKDQQKRRK
jgi:hypothetical protein